MRTINHFAVLLLAVAPLAANAADGTITFNGLVTDKTCTIATVGGVDQVVTLPTVSLRPVRRPAVRRSRSTLPGAAQVMWPRTSSRAQPSISQRAAC
ncbi:hypothetical protein [Stenotrophomonas sp. Iso1]|uniref:hypothetical protein n=1 Tax=Stenotrophomonas sp. Iso1 TaxID=2977283 RepID=UPI0022B7AE89|nr:hypothetical protein [Stenotrophomonas sp. Iso1]